MTEWRKQNKEGQRLNQIQSDRGMKRPGVTRKDNREDAIQRLRQTELDTADGLQRIQLWTKAMQQLIGE